MPQIPLLDFSNFNVYKDLPENHTNIRLLKRISRIDKKEKIFQEGLDSVLSPRFRDSQLIQDAFEIFTKTKLYVLLTGMDNLCFQNSQAAKNDPTRLYKFDIKEVVYYDPMELDEATLNFEYFCYFKFKKYLKNIWAKTENRSTNNQIIDDGSKNISQTAFKSKEMFDETDFLETEVSSSDKKLEDFKNLHQVFQTDYSRFKRVKQTLSASDKNELKTIQKRVNFICFKQDMNSLRPALAQFLGHFKTYLGDAFISNPICNFVDLLKLVEDLEKTQGYRELFNFVEHFKGVLGKFFEKEGIECVRNVYVFYAKCFGFEPQILDIELAAIQNRNYHTKRLEMCLNRVCVEGLFKKSLKIENKKENISYQASKLKNKKNSLIQILKNRDLNIFSKLNLLKSWVLKSVKSRFGKDKDLKISFIDIASKKDSAFYERFFEQFDNQVESDSRIFRLNQILSDPSSEKVNQKMSDNQDKEGENLAEKTKIIISSKESRETGPKAFENWKLKVLMLDSTESNNGSRIFAISETIMDQEFVSFQRRVSCREKIDIQFLTRLISNPKLKNFDILILIRKDLISEIVTRNLMNLFERVCIFHFDSLKPRFLIRKYVKREFSKEHISLLNYHKVLVKHEFNLSLKLKERFETSGLIWTPPENSKIHSRDFIKLVN